MKIAVATTATVVALICGIGVGALPGEGEARGVQPVASLSGERFFELVDGFATNGVYSPSSQGGSQMLIVSVRVSVPGSGTATTPSTGGGISTGSGGPSTSISGNEDLGNYSQFQFDRFHYRPIINGLSTFAGPFGGDAQIVIQGAAFSDYTTKYLDTRCTWTDCSSYLPSSYLDTATLQQYSSYYVDPDDAEYEGENSTYFRSDWPLYYDSEGGWNAYRESYSDGLSSSCGAGGDAAVCSDVYWGPVMQQYTSVVDELCTGALANSSGCGAAYNYLETVAQSAESCSGEPSGCGSGLIVPDSCTGPDAPAECKQGQPLFTYPCSGAACVADTHTVISTSGCALDDTAPACQAELATTNNFLAFRSACEAEGAPADLCSATELPQCTDDGCEPWIYQYGPTVPDFLNNDCSGGSSYWGCDVLEEYENSTSYDYGGGREAAFDTGVDYYTITFQNTLYGALFSDDYWYTTPTPRIEVSSDVDDWYTFDIDAATLLSIEVGQTAESCSGCVDTQISLVELDECGEPAAPGVCGYVAGVTQSALDLYGDCTANAGSPACELFLPTVAFEPAGDWFLSITGTDLSAGGDAASAYTLRLETTERLIETCSVDWTQPGCSSGLNFQWSAYRLFGGCTAGTTSGCPESISNAPQQFDDLSSTIGLYRSFLTPDATTTTNDTFIDTGAPPSIPTGSNLVAEDELSSTYVTPDGDEIIVGKVDVDVFDLTATPEAIATDADGLSALGTEGGPTMGALVTSTGASTGPGAFNLQILNLGKSAVVDGQGMVFEPVPPEQAAAVRDAFAAVALSANGVTSASPTGYCLEEQKAVPTAGELFTFANRGKQEQFGAARSILGAAPEVQQSGALTPDSADADAYYHSIVQWAIWVSEEGLDKEAFAQRFLERTRQNFVNSGQPWDDSYEPLVLNLVDNRYGDITLLLAAADLPVPGDDDAPASAAALPSSWALLGVVAVGVAVFRRRPR